MTKQVLRGCYTAIITPFSREGHRYDHPINYDALDSIVNYGLDGGVDGVVVAGCTGAASVLSHDEQVKLVKHVQEKSEKGRRSSQATEATQHTRLWSLQKGWKAMQEFLPTFPYPLTTTSLLMRVLGGISWR